MPLLTDTEILAALQRRVAGDGEDPLIINPILDRRQIFGTKIELRMDNELYRFRQGTPAEFNLDNPITLNDYADRIIIPYGDDLVLHPGEAMVTYSFEFIRMPANMMGRIEPRARLAKMGLVTSVGTVDPGFEDHLLILFLNSGKFSMVLRPLMRVIGLSLNLLRGKVATTMKEKAIARPRMDPNNLVINLPDFDSRLLLNYRDIASRSQRQGSVKK